MNRHVRSKTHDGAVYCVFCGTCVVNQNEPGIHPCPHTVAAAISEGILHLSQEAVDQLRRRNFKIDVPESPADFYAVAPEDEDASTVPYVTLLEDLEFPDALMVYLPTPAPSGMELVVVLAATEK